MVVPIDPAGGGVLDVGKGLVGVVVEDGLGDALEPDGVEWALTVANRNFIIRRCERDQPPTSLADALERPVDLGSASLQGLFNEAAAALDEAE